jgi:hypothetical protein
MSIVLDGTANTVTPLNGALGATTPSTVVATTINASSTIKGATTIAVGNATPSASGAGITFPATQSASTDANTLDDYEEGTWTVNFSDGTTNSSTTTTGYYTKIGRQVTIVIDEVSNISTAGLTAGEYFRCSLPFAPMAGTMPFYGTAAFSGITYPYSGQNAYILVYGSNDKAYFPISRTTGISPPMLVSAITSGTTDLTGINLTYFTA